MAPSKIFLMSILSLTGSILHGQAQVSAQELTLRENLRTAFTDHGIWLHEAIVSEFSRAANAKAVTRRLLTTPQDIANLFTQYYGKTTSTNLAKLLKDHTQIALDYLVATSSVNTKNRTDALKKLRKNADDLAALLNKTNTKYWVKKDMADMFNKHVDAIIAHITTRLQKDWDKDITAYDDMREQLLSMADALADGIVKQLPKKF